MLSKFSLRYRILGAIVVLLLVLSAMMSRYSENLVEDIILDQTKQQALVWLYGIEREIKHQADNIDDKQINRIIQNAAQFEHQLSYSIYRIYVYDIAGNILADTRVDKPNKKNVSDYHGLVIQSLKPYVGDTIERSWDEQQQRYANKLDIIIPLVLSSGKVVALEAELDMDKTITAIKLIDDAYEENIIWILSAGLVFTIITLFLIFQRGVVSPLNMLVRVTEDISSGNLDARAMPLNTPEFDHLGNSVNKMADSIEQLLSEQEEAYLQMMQSLAKALEAKDAYTASHSGRVANFSVKLGKRIGLNNEELMLLKKGALLHDLGKIGIPDNILNKPTVLNEHEFELMKQHPVTTATIMKPLKRFTAFTEIAAWHHERWDGNGYPDGLKGEETPLLARIVAIADTWDAMTGDRVYRKGMSIEKALAILEQEQHSGQWDPELVAHFISMMKESLNARHDIEHDMFLEQ